MSPRAAEVYLDYAATTPLDPAVLEAMLPALRDVHANPSSVHRAGQRARRLVEEARERVAAAIGARPAEIVFTSGATEADNHALRAVLEGGGHLVTSELEHAAVRATARRLEADGAAVTWLPPDRRGAIDPEAVREALRPDTRLVALMLVNNETGVRTELPPVAAAARERGALVHCDAVQALGFEPLDVGELGVDLLALSAHKAYGPKGVGALWVRSGLELPPLLRGGAQERGRRAGTSNVPAIVGFGVAAELAAARLERDREEVRALRDLFEARLVRLPGVRVNGGEAPRGVKHSNLLVEGADGETLLMALDAAGIAASAGSACAAGSLEPSHVLTAMGLDRAAAKASLRFTFGRGLEREAVAGAAERVVEAIGRVRAALA